MRIFSILTLFSLFSVSLFSGLFFVPAHGQQTEDSAIILMYHRFGDGRFPTTNVTLDQFDAHLAELKKDKYNIMPLDKIVTALKNNIKLPPRTIAITIDDAYSSILVNAWPRLRAANIPFTLFISTAPINDKIPGYMSWEQIKSLSQNSLVSIGHHGHSHDHLSYLTADKAAKDIDRASEIYQEQLGGIPDIFAYPYGEFTPMLENILKKKGIKAAFGQYSSAASSKSDLYALPRFSFNEKYSGMERFELIVNARALPAYDILPINAVIGDNPPKIGFTVDKNIRGLSAMSCYPSHLGKAAEIIRLGDNRIEIRFDKPLPGGRSRINCTMPGPNKRWYWFGLPFFVK